MILLRSRYIHIFFQLFQFGIVDEIYVFRIRAAGIQSLASSQFPAAAPHAILIFHYAEERSECGEKLYVLSTNAQWPCPTPPALCSSQTRRPLPTKWKFDFLNYFFCVLFFSSFRCVDINIHKYIFQLSVWLQLIESRKLGKRYGRRKNISNKGE